MWCCSRKKTNLFWDFCKQPTMPTCPVCKFDAPGNDHRWCVLELFKTNQIQSVEDWERKCVTRKIIRVREPAVPVARNLFGSIPDTVHA